MGRTILLVDDEPGFLSVLADALTRRGHQVHTAMNGAEALQHARDHHPEIMIVDWMLRGADDGIDLASAAYNEGSVEATIVMSGFPAKEFDRQISRVPNARFLAKPFSLADLDAMIDATSKGEG